MALRSSREHETRGFAAPRRLLVTATTTICITLAAIQIWLAARRQVYQQQSRFDAQPGPTVNHTSSSLRAIYRHQQHERTNDNDNIDQCRFYLAESAIPHGGLGIFVGAQDLLEGDMIAFPDICIFVADMDNDKVKDWMHMRTHTWGRGNFFGQFEGRHNRAACEGVVTTFNTMPDHMVNSKIISLRMPTNAGLDRATQVGAGAISHHFGIHAEAVAHVSAGSELTVYYGDFPFDPKRKDYIRPQRDPAWLVNHGWCMDHIEIRPATDPVMGRGAFVKRSLPAERVVAPAPLQLFRDRSVFQDSIPEQLYVNYCFQPRNSTMMLFPYGQGVNLINHSRRHANVYLRWSKKSANHKSWLDLSVDKLFKVAKPGGLVLEVVALRPLQAGEELFLDYGADWDDAWKKHVAEWKPVTDADKYVYPADMDESAPLRTMQEQVDHQPYAFNLATMCVVPDRDDVPDHGGYNHVWHEPTEYDWWQSLFFCHVLDRQVGDSGEYVYTISALLDYRTYGSETSLDYDPSIPWNELYIETQVPRRAIHFVEKPYMDDEHLYNAFRHPIQFPDELTPEAWKTA